MGSGKPLVGHDGIDQLGWPNIFFFNWRSWILKKPSLKTLPCIVITSQVPIRRCMLSDTKLSETFAINTLKHVDPIWLTG